MALTTPVKVASGLGVTATLATGSVLSYRYVNSPYSIENLVADKDSSWKIKTEETNKVIFTTIVADNEKLKNNYGLSEGDWTCKIKVKSGTNDNLKTKLKSYFGLGSDISSSGDGTSLTSVPLENKTSFVNSCSKHRKGSSSNSKVTSEIEIDSNKLNEELEALFGGVPLLKPDKDAIEAKSWTITTSNSSTGEPKTFTVKSVISSQPEDSSWICTVTSTAKNATSAIDLAGIKPQLKKFLGVEIDTNSPVTASPKNKEGFVTSCARNRKTGSNPTSTKVEGELKLELETPKEGSNYTFKEGDLEKVFEGTWTNSSAA